MNVRDYPMLGASIVPGGVQFDVWAPAATSVSVAIDGIDRAPALTALAGGYFTGMVKGVGAGARYRFQLDDGPLIPDPYSRSQPDGVHGASEVVDPTSFAWSDGEWPGITMAGQIIYELHVGTFTPAGTFAGVIEQLPGLQSLGVTAIELMPVAAFPGRWNWGYDGVLLFAPTENYGRPDDLRRLVDAAHRHGIAILMDVVYNHLGPDGNYLRLFSPTYFTDRHQTPWGEAINYDGEGSRAVRDFVIANARMWIREYHIDGLRLDATDSIKDDSTPHLLEELTLAARAAAGDRSIVVIAEDARNEATIIRDHEAGGYGLDGVWADDFHHAIRVALTGGRENYYAAYSGAPDEITRAIEEGFTYQGEISPVTEAPRGTVITDEPAQSFVFCIQNHDQVGNRPFGDRLHHTIDHGRALAAAALLLFAPETPLIFMGQEFAASTPFAFFTDHHDELGHLVTAGRRQEFAGFEVFHREELRELIPDPQDESTFTHSKLDLRERELHAGTYAWYRDLIRLRRNDPVLQEQDRKRTTARAIAFSTFAVTRWNDESRRLLIANFGPKLELDRSEIAPGNWTILLDSTDPRYGSSGRRFALAEATLTVPARSAAILALE